MNEHAAEATQWRLKGIRAQLWLIVVSQFATIAVGMLVASGQLYGLRQTPGAAAALNACMRIEIITLIVALVVSGALAWWVARSLSTRALEVFTAFTKIFENCFPRLAATIEGLSNGDLTARYVPVCEPIPVRGHDEVTQIAVLHNRLLTEGFYVFAERLAAGFESLTAMIIVSVFSGPSCARGLRFTMMEETHFSS